MNKPGRVRIVFLIVLLCPIYAFRFCVAQPVDVGVGVGFMPGSGGPGEVKKSTAVPTSIFVDHIAKKMNKDPVKMQGLWRRGYGFVELIKLSLIADGANQPFDKIVEQRGKNAKLSAIAKKYNLDYENIYRRSYEIKSELDSEVIETSSATERQQ